MGRTKIVIPEEVLRTLYINKSWSPRRIGARYNCDAITVRARLREAGILLKTKSVAHSKYKKRDFDGSDIEKAYMLGFKYGDLNAYRPPGVSAIVVIRSHTTHLVQQKLFNRLFRRYGRISTSYSARSIQQTCYLNDSFLFLLGKYPSAIRQWIAFNKELFWPFAAGYIDAEGTFGLNQGKGRFKIDAYDYVILSDLHALFLRHGIRSKFRIIARKGENDYGWLWKENVWRLSVNEAASIESLIGLLKPHLLHSKRVSDARQVMQNIVQRRKHGTIK